MDANFTRMWDKAITQNARASCCVHTHKRNFLPNNDKRDMLNVLAESGQSSLPNMPYIAEMGPLEVWKRDRPCTYPNHAMTDVSVFVS